MSTVFSLGKGRHGMSLPSSFRSRLDSDTSYMARSVQLIHSRLLIFWTSAATFTVEYNQSKEWATSQEYGDWEWPTGYDE